MRSRAISALLFALVLARPAGAEPPPRTGPSDDAILVPRDTAPSEAEARAHFERALSEYRAGRYRKAVAELDAALAKDPAGKDLVFNLALVHEKLGELDRAIGYLERFLQMEEDPVERERAEQAILRLRGAEQEMIRSQTCIEKAAVPPRPAEPLRYGRLDGWVAAAAGVATAAVIVGVVFGVRALDQRESWTEEAARPGATPGDVAERADEAQTSALIANVAFSLGIAAGAGAAALYFARPERPKSGQAVASPTRVDPALARGEWSVGFAGAF